MKLIEFILYQPHLAANIFSHLSFSEILELTDVSKEFHHFVYNYLGQADSFCIKFDIFKRHYFMAMMEDFLSAKTNLKALKISLEEEAEGGMDVLCDLITRNSNLNKVEIVALFQLPEQLLRTISFTPKLESFQLTANCFCDPCEKTLNRFYSNLSRNCTTLKRIVIKQFMNDANLASLATLPQLRSISIIECDVTDTGLRKLVGANQQLQRMRLVNTLITNTSLDLISLKYTSNLQELFIVNLEELNGVKCVVDVITRCRGLTRFKFVYEDRRLLVYFDHNCVIKLNFMRCTFEIEDILVALRTKLRGIRKLHIIGASFSRVLLDVIATECLNLRELFVCKQDSSRHRANFADVVESEFVVKICEANNDLATFHLDAQTLDKKACQSLACEGRKITCVKIKLRHDINEDYWRILENRFGNHTRTSRIFKGKRKILN